MTNVILCWTDDGRVWIDSERNQKLANRLRYQTVCDNNLTTLDQAADSLDGGAR